MSIIDTSDFGTGKYELYTGMYDAGKINSYITKYEVRYLTELLGTDLYLLFAADLIAGGGTPLEPRFLVIFNALSFDWCHRVVFSDGMREMLTGFIYYEYTKDQIVQMTPLGNVRPVGENSEVAGSLYTQIYNRYNEGVKAYRAIQTYICDNPESYDYSDFNGVKKGLVTWL